MLSDVEDKKKKKVNLLCLKFSGYPNRYSSQEKLHFFFYLICFMQRKFDIEQQNKDAKIKQMIKEEMI